MFKYFFLFFREGSVIVDYSVQFSENDSVPPEQLNSIVSSAVNNNAFGPDLRIDLASISHTSTYSRKSKIKQLCVYLYHNICLFYHIVKYMYLS